jgi:signal transduction histidine kinase
MTTFPLTEALHRPPLTLVVPARCTDRERFELLLDAGRVLDDPADLAASLRALARLATSRLGDVCIIDLVAGETAAPLAVAHADLTRAGEAQEIRRRHPPRPDERAGVAEVIRTGRAELHAELPRDVASLRAFRELGAASAIVAPIRTPMRVMGAITVLAGTDRRLDAADLCALEDIGARAGTAAAMVASRDRPPRSERDRERLLALEKEARAAAEVAVHRIATLQSLTGALSEAVTLAQVADVIVGEGVSSLGAQMGALFLVDVGAEAVDLVAQRGMPPAMAAALDRLPITAATAAVASAISTGKPVWLAGREQVRAACPEIARRLAGEHEPAALAALPLAAGGRVVGVLGLCFDEPEALPEEDRVFALALVRNAAQAIDRARLYEAERQHNQRLMKMAAESREAMERAQEANRRSELASRTKDEFLGVVSHELRTPLNAVLGWSQLLRGPAAADPAVLTKGLSVIDRNARAQAKLIEDILDVSRIIAGKLLIEPRPIDLDGVIRAALDVIRPAAEAKSIELSTRPSPRAQVSGDPDRLQQVVWNLVSNAVKFTPEGGRVEIALERERTSVSIVVRDTGRGIEPDVLPHVFERFWQADSSPTRRHGGLGLGLAIARHLVELHGGSVRAESAGLGAGATFTVSLPAREDPAFADAEARTVRDSAPGATPVRLDGLHVLVVDDEADARELVSAMLASAGAAVAVAGSAAAAWTSLVQATPDVLVSDLGMPGEDGHALIRRVRGSGRLCRLPALALTAYAGPEDARRAVRAGFHTHLPKPVEPCVLAAVVASLGGRAP